MSYRGWKNSNYPQKEEDPYQAKVSKIKMASSQIKLASKSHLSFKKSGFQTIDTNSSKKVLTESIDPDDFRFLRKNKELVKKFSVGIISNEKS